jgi:hypothetical protein
MIAVLLVAILGLCLALAGVGVGVYRAGWRG